MISGNQLTSLSHGNLKVVFPHSSIKRGSLLSRELSGRCLGIDILLTYIFTDRFGRNYINDLSSFGLFNVSVKKSLTRSLFSSDLCLSNSYAAISSCCCDSRYTACPIIAFSRRPEMTLSSTQWLDIRLNK